MGNTHYGFCALCGQETELTYEHIPPRKAFNWFSARTVSVLTCLESDTSNRKPWDFSGLPYNDAQRGTGAYSLCQKCNNNTGTWYGEEYVRFVYGFHGVMVKLQPSAGTMMNIEEATFRPLPVFKQIISMFCSINPGNINDERFQLLRQFVLNKNDTAFNKERLKVGMYLFAGGIQRCFPISAEILTGSAIQSKIRILSEITTYPVGFILYIDPDADFKMPILDITCFCDSSYEQEAKVQMVLPVYECNRMSPGDFRSKEELEECRKVNSECSEES